MPTDIVFSARMSKIRVRPTSKQRIIGEEGVDFNWNIQLKDNFKASLDHDVFRKVKEAGTELNQPAYIVGGWVRDLILSRPSKDVDVVTVGSGIKLAEQVAEHCLDIEAFAQYKRFGTAMLRTSTFEVEFVGARKESYRSDSRNPIVEDGTLEDDQKRRDFTINALSISLNESTYGDLTDPFNGMEDLKKGLIRTPLDPTITFKDDPLRMMRAIRFSCQLGFEIEDQAFEAIKDNADRLKIISKERITDEFNKILLSPKPSIGLAGLFYAGLMKYILPELNELQGVEEIDGQRHKDNFFHTLEVVDNIATKTNNLYLIYAALFHDIAKPRTKKFDKVNGFTFRGHEHLGSKMVPRIFKRMRLPLSEPLRYVQKLVALSARPSALVSEDVTDSGLRRLLYEAGDDIEDLMTLSEADITTKNAQKMTTYLENFSWVRRRLKEVEEKDSLRNFQPPVDGGEIIQRFNLTPGPIIGQLKNDVKEAILEGKIANNKEEAWKYIENKARELGL